MNQRPVLRRGVACRKRLDRQLLLKVTRDYRDGVVLEGGMGRSAYLCPSKDCLDECWSRKRLQKALRCPIPPSIMEMLQNRLNHCTESDSAAI